MRNPLLLLVLNFAVGYLVANGWVNPDIKDELINQLADVIGLGIIFLTSIVSLFKVWKHQHPTTTSSLIVETKQAKPSTTETTKTIEQDSGTPPLSPVVQ